MSPSFKASRSRRFLSALLATCLVGVMVAPVAPLIGCEEKKKPAPPPPPPPPPPPRAPDPVQVDGILQSMQADARVQFPQGSAPYSEDVARAVIMFADALAKGDADAMRRMLGPSGQNVLDRLLADGEWETATDKIEGVRVVAMSHSGPESPSADFGLAIQEAGSAYALRWSATKSGGNWVFEPLPSTAQSLPRAADFDTQSLSDLSLTEAAVVPPPVATAPGATAGGEPAATPAASTPSSTPAAPSGPSAPPPPAPRRKNTPSGPVTIPGGG